MQQKKYGLAIDYIYRSVQAGVLKQGDFLPSVRVLAKQIGVSTSPVYVAYATLEEQGIVESVERRGFRLIDTSKIPFTDECDRPKVPIPEILLSYLHISNKDNDDIVQLGAALPSNEYFPNEELSRCLSRTARKFQQDINVYGFAYNKFRSFFYLERETSQYIFRVHGISIPGAEICNTSGANEAIRYALRAVTVPGDLIAVESPGFLGAYIIINQLNLKPLEISTAFPHGLDIDEFEQILKNGERPRCLIVTPNFQNPTGATMPHENRERLLQVCHEYNVIIIEDDTLGALRFGERLSSLKEQMPDEVIYVSSYSKTFAPGYRVGWAAGGKYSFNIQAIHMLESTEDSLVGHLAVTDYVQSGKYAPHIKNLRSIYKENCEVMRNYIQDVFPKGTKITSPEGGIYLWVSLPKGVSSEKLYHKALDHDILLAPGNLFGSHRTHDNSIRICYAMPFTPRIADALEIVGNLIRAEIK